MTVSGKPILVTDVPQGACPQCGSRVYPPADLQRIETLMQGRKLQRSY